MKMVWCPETAEKSYLDTVKQLGRAKESSAAEFISAMAGGWKSKLIVEAWTNNNGAIASSIGLAIAAHHSGGRHVCIVPDEMSKREYISAMGSFCGRFLLPEIMVGDASVLLLERLPGIDFLVVDGHRKDVARIFSFAKLSNLGAVVVCKNSNKSKFFGLRWNRFLSFLSSFSAAAKPATILRSNFTCIIFYIHSAAFERVFLSSKS
ncbi:hypothetical protein M9H77_33377 [Catharanthus roseus]|uniref:Uncharacterized protein n=1 Tax=Catharanthus roseus TaxID=4058 RepID=A0ACB9ZMD3_CATRO|nr:hypothetical protein M9H77_33377 [Catharanthus roseus]